MRNYLAGFLHAIDIINERTGKVLSVLIVFMTLILAYEVVLRYGFDSPTKWAHEITCSIFAAYGVLGGGYALFLNQHIRSDIVYARFSERGKAICDLITFPLLFMLLILIFIQGFDMALSSTLARETTVSMFRSPVYPVKICIPLAALLMLLQALAMVIRNFWLVIKREELK
jgi:TRAP-type mannitol/chloroaromatic compound transport system permease small subunit